MLSQFFKGWNRCISDVCNEHEEFNSVFVSSAYQITPEGEERCDEFQVLDVSISPEDTTIYSALDNMIWSDEENSVVVNFAEVFCVHLKTEFHINGGQGIEIPAVLYPDRYTRLWLDTVKSLREQISVQKARIANLDSKEARLKLFKSRNNEYNPKSLLEITISHFATSLRINNDDGPDDIMMDSQPELPDPTPLLKELLRKLEKNLLSRFPTRPVSIPI